MKKLQEARAEIQTPKNKETAEKKEREARPFKKRKRRQSTRQPHGAQGGCPYVLLYSHIKLCKQTQRSPLQRYLKIKRNKTEAEHVLSEHGGGWACPLSVRRNFSLSPLHRQWWDSSHVAHFIVSQGPCPEKADESVLLMFS